MFRTLHTTKCTSLSTNLKPDGEVKAPLNQYMNVVRLSTAYYFTCTIST